MTGIVVIYYSNFLSTDRYGRNPKNLRTEYGIRSARQVSMVANSTHKYVPAALVR
jgi:hypothetical protein